MKIKGDFVTNSSSTNFFFIFKQRIEKDNLETLCELIEEHLHICISAAEPERGYFEEDLIEVIKSKKDSIEFKTLESLIKEKNKQIKRFEKSESNNDENKKVYDYSDILNEIRIFTETLKIAKKRGNDTYMELSFGDHEGDITEGLGEAMDYEKPRLLKDDLFLLNENHH